LVSPEGNFVDTEVPLALPPGLSLLLLLLQEVRICHRYVLLQLCNLLLRLPHLLLLLLLLCGAPVCACEGCTPSSWQQRQVVSMQPPLVCCVQPPPCGCGSSTPVPCNALSQWALFLGFCPYKTSGKV
jgi:hypothetical protein